jgi:hypothetical protein
MTGDCIPLLPSFMYFHCEYPVVKLMEDGCYRGAFMGSELEDVRTTIYFLFMTAASSHIRSSEYVNAENHWSHRSI